MQQRNFKMSASLTCQETVAMWFIKWVEAPSFYRGSPTRVLHALIEAYRYFIVEVAKPSRKFYASPPKVYAQSVNCETALCFRVLECVFIEAGLSWEEARAREVLCSGNSAPPGRPASSGLPAVLLEIFVHFMAEFQGHSGFTGFLQACIHACIHSTVSSKLYMQIYST